MLGIHTDCKKPIEGHEGNESGGTCSFAGTINKVGRQKDEDYIEEINVACDALDAKLTTRTAKWYIHGDYTTSNESLNQKFLKFRPKMIHFRKSERARLLFAAMDWNAQLYHIDSSCVGGAEGNSLEEILKYRMAWRQELLDVLLSVVVPVTV